MDTRPDIQVQLAAQEVRSAVGRMIELAARYPELAFGESADMLLTANHLSVAMSEVRTREEAE